MAKPRAPIEKCHTRLRWWWRRAHSRSKTGVVVTLIYLIAMLITVLVQSEKFLALNLNELGDFLAGTFAPLALLWLVIGYFQQGDELRQNSRALLLQAQELRQAAEHAGGLLDVARKEHEIAVEQLRAEQRGRELEAERKAEAAERRRKDNLQPRLSFDLAFIKGENEARVQLRNNGNDCSEFSIEIPEKDVLRLVNFMEPSNFNARASMFLIMVALKELGTTPLIAHWTDAEGERYQQTFIASVADKTISIGT